MMPIIDEMKLRNLLEANHWFNRGGPHQYKKLLEVNANGTDLKALTAIIWSCSESNVTQEDIYNALKKAEIEEFDKFFEHLYKNCNYIDNHDFCELLYEDPCICYVMV